MNKIFVFSLIFVQIIILCLLLGYNRIIEDFDSFDENEIKKTKIFRINTNTYDKSISVSLPSNFIDLMTIDSRYVMASKYNNASFIMFDSINLIESVMEKMQWPLSAKYIFAFKGIDLLANKLTLTKFLSGTRYIPKSYDMTNSSEMRNLLDNMKFGDKYILKKNVQQQTGLKLINSQNDLSMVLNSKDNYVVCQELLLDPLIIARRKINIRIYLLITIEKSKLNMYMYNDGFMYYAPEDWDNTSFNPSVHITTGLMKDRSIYSNNPLTYMDLKSYLGESKGRILEANILEAFSELKRRYQERLIDMNRDTPGRCFSLFGCDIAPNESLKVKFMEINKGPDLTYKDERDKNVKINLTMEMMGLVCHDDAPKNFLQII